MPVYGDEGYDEPTYEIGATAAPVESAPVERTPREDRGNRSDRGDRSGRDQGDRNRGDRNRGDRATQQPPRVPRGFAPSLDLYKVAASADETLSETPYGQETEAAAPAEPLILPGESLSKYRPGSSAPASPRVDAAPVPAAEFTLLGAWDGGFVLRVKPSARVGQLLPLNPPVQKIVDLAATTVADETAMAATIEVAETTVAEEMSVTRVPIVAPARSATPSPPSPASSSLFSPAEPTESSYETHSVAPIHSTFVPPPPVPSADEFEAFHEAPTTFAADHADVAPEFAAYVSEPEIEFEPTEASASFRVDPVPPSEFRQSSPVLESPTEEAHVETPSSLAEPKAAVDLSSAPSFEVEHESNLPTIHGVPEGMESISAHTQDTDEAAPPAPEFTSINDFGEMHSEPFVAAPELSHEPDSSAPIEHEAAIVSGSADPYQTTAPGSFAPGDGHLEEEELVEDEDHLQLHATAFHDQETARDQETLEGVADLGTMLREMSIDNITRTEPAAFDEEDDEDLEEDFLEEDQLEDDDSLDSEYAEEDSPKELESDELGDSGEPHEELEAPAHASDFEVTPPASSGEPNGADVSSEPRRELRRDDRGRRDGRRGDRNRRDGRGDRDRSSSSSSSSGGDRDRSRDSRDSRGGRNSRQSVQSTNLPAISDLLKPGQEILCQIAKEPIAKKGARITSHIALPGRFLVFMPTVHHTGVSRKIESDSERRRLKEILISERGEASGGFIVRTGG